MIFFDFFLSCWQIIDQFPKKRKHKRVFGQIKQAGAELNPIHVCKIQNGRQGAPKWPTGSGKLSKQLLLNKLFDPSTPSMRKGNSGENGEQRRKEKSGKKWGEF